MSYHDDLANLQEKRRELRELEARAERTAKSLSPITEADERAMANTQSRFDGAYKSADRRAPPPLSYERPEAYERRLASGLAKYSPRWSKANFDTMHPDAFKIVQDQVREDASKFGPTHGLGPTEIKQVTSNSGGGHVIHEFIGGPEAHFTQEFRRPPRVAVFKSREQYEQISQNNLLAKLTERIPGWARTMVGAPRAGF